jgi:DNA-directed RNA polymerase subunit RPC12/RpoP
LLGKSIKCPLCSATFTARKAGAPPATTDVPGMVTINCDTCRKPLRLPEKLVGGPVKCPHCTKVFKSRKPAGTPGLLQTARPAPPPPKRPAAPHKPADKQKPGAGMPTINVHCARCRRALRLPETALGKSLRCPRCGMVFTAKPKAPEVSSWVNYPVEKEEQREAAAPPLPAPKPMKKAPPAQPAAATEDPADLFGVLDPSRAAVPPAPVAPIEDVVAEAPLEYAEPPAETADFGYGEPSEVPLTAAQESLSPPTEQAGWGDEEAQAQQEPAPYEEIVAPPPVDNSSDVFAAYTDSPKKKKKKRDAELEEAEAEQHPRLDDGPDQPLDQPAEPTEDAEAAEKPSEDVYAFAPEDDGGASSGKSAMLWFIGGMVLGGLSAGGLGTLMMLKVI